MCKSKSSVQWWDKMKRTIIIQNDCIFVQNETEKKVHIEVNGFVSKELHIQNRAI